MIVQNRERKGHHVSMSFADFRQLFTDFPGIYKIFAVRDRSRMVAVTVAVEINKHILYYFLPAHDEAYNTYSPMVLLIQCLYDYCRQAGFTLLDLGISTDKGVPNYGLMRFKQNIGAVTSLKLSFVKNLTVF
jgi:lipid II:glycine glycyltransferase (peptidoglycan interpeptide bridge formation enzyme)